MRLARVVLGFVILAAGCGGGSAPIVEAPDATTSATAVAWDRARPVDVVLDEYSFTPSRLVLRWNEPYVLHLRNGGSTRHTFTAPEFFRSVTFRPGPVATAIRDSGGTVALAPGETAEVDISPQRAGTYPLMCDRPLHPLFGMTGEIVVE